MRILIDARMMGAGNTRGIGRYIEEILKAMIAQKPDHQYVLLERDPSVSPFADHPSVEHIKADIPWYGLAEQLKLPEIVASANADIFFAPHWNIPYNIPSPVARRPLPLVIFIHDLILLEEPSSANVSTRGPLIRWIKRIGHRIILKRALSMAKVILVPTHHVGNRIKYYYPEITTRIIVTGEGMPQGWVAGSGDRVSENPTHHAPRATHYLLMVGSAYPHKNHAAVLEAWKAISRKYPELHLRIVGTKDTFMERVMKRANALKLSNVEFLGQLSDEELDRVYEGALALVFPSRWEGFGLPPLEALAHGIPVLSSNASCMPEVLGDRGVIYFNPDSPDAIVKAVENLLRDPGGVHEEAIQAIALLRTRHDWKIAAARTIRAIEEAIH